MALVRLRESKGSRHDKLRATTDPTYNSRIQAAKDGIVAGRYKSISAAARDQNVAHSTLEDEERLAQIERDIRDKTFDALSTLCRKDDYITLAGALGISRDGTVEELKTRIKDYLANPANALIAENPRFTALFHAKGRARALPPNLSETARARSPTPGPSTTSTCPARLLNVHRTAHII